MGVTAVNDARPSMKDNWFGFELGGEYSMLEITTKRKKCRTVRRVSKVGRICMQERV